MKRETVESFPSRLVELRTAKGWSQEELAQRAGTSVFSISKMERGQRAPSLLLACQLADALEVSLDSLREPAKSGDTEKARGRPKKKKMEK